MKIKLTEKQIESLQFQKNLYEKHRRVDVRLGKKLLAAGFATLVKAGDEDRFGGCWRVDSYFVSDSDMDMIIAQYPQIAEEKWSFNS